MSDSAYRGGTVGAGEIVASAQARNRSSALIWAWLGVLAASDLVPIVWRAGFHGSDSAWINVMQLALVLILLARARSNAGLRPLTILFSMLAAEMAGFLVLRLAEDATGFTAWTAVAPGYQWIPAQSALNLVPTVAMVAVALAAGLKRGDLFLTPGNLSARSRIPGTRRFTRWDKLALPLLAILTVPLVIQLALASPPNAGRLMEALALLPLGIGFAALNSFQEEVRFRAVPIAALEGPLGGEAAIWITAAAFGLAHWYGHPSGPTGVIMAFLAGLFLAKAYVETRGIFWSWTLHAVFDLVIFLFLVIQA